MKAKYIGIVLLAGVMLAGCSGGSSSGSTSSGATSSTVSKVSITTDNQSKITNSAINSATQNLAGSNLAYVGGVQTSATPTNERVISKWTDFAFKKIAEHQSAPLSVSGIIVSTSQCTSGGTITLDTDGSDTAPVTPYTYFTISFNNCVENGTTTNGTISLSNLTITKNTGNVVTGISATFTFNFTSTSGLISYGIYGGFTIAATGINTTSRTDSISGTSLNFKYGTQYETLTAFSFTSTYDDVATTHGYSDTVNYTFASDVILAGFNFNTITPLVKNYGDLYPRSGQVVITGANSTKLRVTVVSADPNAGTASGTVQLELDQGTGLGYGTPVPKTWTQLANNT